MSDVWVVDELEQAEQEGMVEVGSRNHSRVQANLAFLFKKLGEYTVFTELSLDIKNVDLTQFDLRVSSELKVDVCLYPKQPMNPLQDILKMEEMPLLAVEIISPRQGLYEITEKFRLYFSLGVKSCWLVIPNNQTVTVYRSATEFHNYGSDDVIDQQLDVQIPIQEIFE